MWAALNMTAAPFGDVRVRKAVQQGIDWAAYKGAMNGGGKFDLNYHLRREPGPFFDKNLAFPQYDKAAAQKLLDEYVASTGNEIRINIRPATSVANWAEFLQAQLGAFDHVKVSIDPVVANQVPVVLKEKQYGMLFTIIESYDPEPSLFDSLRTGGAREFQGYSKPALDALLDKGRAAVNVADRVAAYQEAQRLIIEDQPGIWNPIVTQQPRILMSPKVKGFAVTQGFIRYDEVSVSD